MDKIQNISEIRYDFTLALPKSHPVSKCAPFAEKIIEKYGCKAPPTPLDLDQIVKKANDNIKNGIMINLKDLKKLAFEIFNDDFDIKFSRLILKEIEKYKKQNIDGVNKHLSALLAVYVMNFDSSCILCQDISELLNKNKDNFSRFWLRILKEIDLLNIYKIEAKIADQLLSIKGDERTYFNQIGLGGTYAVSNLAKNSLIYLATLYKQKNLDGDLESIYRFLDIVCDGDGIRIGAETPAMIGLLSPFFDNNPPSALKNRLQTLFTKSFSDPRINRSKWPEILSKFGGNELRENCISLVKRWLIFDTIEMFLKVIAEHALNDQFEPRRILWKAYFDQDYVVDAHIILGSAAAGTAKRLIENGEIANGLHFGEFAKKPKVDSDQSVLLMKIGSLTIAEWSHNGKFRAWSDDSIFKPRFHRLEYDAGELRMGSNKIRQNNGNMGDGIVHLGNWVDRAKRYINTEENIKLEREIR